jgi:hypothetical protein
MISYLYNSLKSCGSIILNYDYKNIFHSDNNVIHITYDLVYCYSGNFEKYILNNIPNTFIKMITECSAFTEYVYLPSSLTEINLGGSINANIYYKLGLPAIHNLPNKITNIFVENMKIGKICFKLKNTQFFRCSTKIKKINIMYPSVLLKPLHDDIKM